MVLVHRTYVSLYCYRKNVGIAFASCKYYDYLQNIVALSNVDSNLCMYPNALAVIREARSICLNIWLHKYFRLDKMKSEKCLLFLNMTKKRRFRIIGLSVHHTMCEDLISQEN